MRRAVTGLFTAAAILVIAAASAAHAQVRIEAAAAATGIGAQPASASLLSRPVALRGTLGDAIVQFNLVPKPEVDGGFEGDYFLFGDSRKILLAGEADGDDLFFEESENGTDVSGQWEGKLSGDTFSGTWLSADGSVAKPFRLKAIELDGK
jgi:hypothetical protein